MNFYLVKTLQFLSIQILVMVELKLEHVELYRILSLLIIRMENGKILENLKIVINHLKQQPNITLQA